MYTPAQELLTQLQACAVIHDEAVTVKQRYSQNAQQTGFKKASECNVYMH